MKNLLKLSALAAVVVASATYASADVITLNSGTATTTYLGYTVGNGAGDHFNDRTEAQLGGVDLGSGASNPATKSIGTGIGGQANTWESPIAGTSWITSTQLAGAGTTEPGGIVVPDGYYAFQTSFTALAGETYTGSFSVAADDTVAVLINGHLFITPGLIGGDGKCSDQTPNCASIFTTAFGSGSNGFQTGNNNVIFIVEQTGESAMGLDYAVSLTGTPVPEPSTLLMLGTGLIGSAGAMFRRMRRS